jgi:hypothetical protein
MVDRALKSGHPRLNIIRQPDAPPPVSGVFVPRELPARPGRLEQQLRALWSPQVRARLWTPRHWLDQLRLRRQYMWEELTADELALDFGVGTLPDCDTCEEVCCTGPHRVVLLRLVDVAALVDAGLADHMTLEKPTYSDAELQANPALWDMVHSQAWQVMPVLKQDATRTCSLLTQDNRCGAWPAWPLSCARFPYALDIAHNRVFYARSCNSVTRDFSRSGRKRETALVDAVVEAFNQRLRDAVLLTVAREELRALGLDRYLKVEGNSAP